MKISLPEKDIQKIQSLLDKGCTLKAIQEYMYPEWKIKNRLNNHIYHKIKIKRPKYHVHIPVKCILKFWEHLPELKLGKISQPEFLFKCTKNRKYQYILFKFMYKLFRTNNIKILKVRQHQRQLKLVNKNTKFRTNSEQILAKELHWRTLYKLYGFGADFLYKYNNLNIVIETKTTLSRNSTTTIPQLLYAKDMLLRDKNIKVDKLWLISFKINLKNKFTNIDQRYLEHFGIESFLIRDLPKKITKINNKGEKHA